MLIIGFGDAGALTTTCPDCHKCVSYSGPNCIQCEYDVNYCGTINPDDPVMECMGNAQYDSLLRRCVCDANTDGSISASEHHLCIGAWTFWDGSDDYCACHQFVCISGQYPKAVDQCTDCPVPDFTLKSGSIESSINYADDEATESISGKKNGCYIPGGSTATDASGTFELTSDCLYKGDGGGDFSEIGGEEFLLP